MCWSSGAGSVWTHRGHLPIHQDLFVRAQSHRHSPTSQAASCGHLALSFSFWTTYAAPLTCLWCDKLCVLVCVIVSVVCKCEILVAMVRWC